MPPMDASDTRRRINKKDEAIRKKVELELQRKSGKRAAADASPIKRRGVRRPRAPAAQPGTVAALRPTPALTVPQHISVADASQLCAAKRSDCVLVVDDYQRLVGIFTAKDLAFRVVAKGVDPRSALVCDIMTPAPMVTRETMSATDALDTMVSRGFRHLPVCNSEGDIAGLLDIAKVFHEALEKLERAYGSSQKLYNALEGVQTEWGTGAVGPQNTMLTYIEALREKMALPDLSTCLGEGTEPCMVSVRTSVLEAARMMKQHRTTAVCVMEGTGDAYGAKIAGIFTSKDVVLRVMAAGLDPRTCSVVRVMTPHPDTVPPEMSIQTALRKMHDGHYLNLPVLDGVQLVGVVDVLRLTWKTLEQINSMADEGGSTETNGGPMWNHFWNSFGTTTYAGSMGSASIDGDSFVSQESPNNESGYPGTPSQPGAVLPAELSSDVFPHESASAVAAAEMARGEAGSTTHDSNSKVQGAASEGVDQTPLPANDGHYLFKFTTPTKRTHRFQAPYDNLEHVREVVSIKLAGDDFFAAPTSVQGDAQGRPDPHDFKLAYEDDEGDDVEITSDQDMVDAVALAHKLGKDRVTLHVHGGPTWVAATPCMATTSGTDTPKTGHSQRPTPASRVEAVPAAPTDLHSTPDGLAPKRPKADTGEEELIFGVIPKDLALPAAVGFLGVAVLLAVAISRPSH